MSSRQKTLAWDFWGIRLFAHGDLIEIASRKVCWVQHPQYSEEKGCPEDAEATPSDSVFPRKCPLRTHTARPTMSMASYLNGSRSMVRNSGLAAGDEAASARILPASRDAARELYSPPSTNRQHMIHWLCATKNMCLLWQTAIRLDICLVGHDLC